MSFFFPALCFSRYTNITNEILIIPVVYLNLWFFSCSRCYTKQLLGSRLGKLPTHWRLGENLEQNSEFRYHSSSRLWFTSPLSLLSSRLQYAVPLLELHIKVIWQTKALVAAHWFFFSSESFSFFLDWWSFYACKRVRPNGVRDCNANWPTEATVSRTTLVQFDRDSDNAGASIRPKGIHKDIAIMAGSCWQICTSICLITMWFHILTVERIINRWSMFGT